jgi:hypothetical protein
MQVVGQGDLFGAHKQLTTRECMRDIMQQSGLRGLGKGFTATCVRDLPGFGM